MPFTDNNGVLLYAAVNEHGINRFVRLAMQQQPSRFYYATRNLITNHALLCQAMQEDLTSIHAEVAKRGNPWITEEQPLPVIGTNGAYALDYAFQVSVVAVDFSPASAITLPP